MAGTPLEEEAHEDLLVEGLGQPVVHAHGKALLSVLCCRRGR